MIAPLLKAGADVEQRRPSNGTTALMLAAASGNVDAVQALLDARRRRQREGAGARPDAGDVRRGVEPRRGHRRCSRSTGADLKATSKVDRPRRRSAAIRRRCASSRNGNPHAARRAAGRRAAAVRRRSARAGGRGGRGGRRHAGVDRNYQLNELVAAQGGLTPLLLAAREGHIEPAQALLDAGADVNQASAGDKTSPLLIATINGHFDLAKLLLDKRRRSERGGRERRDAALCGAQLRVGAQGALSAAARAPESEDRPIST